MSSPELPDLDDPCGRYFSYRDFVECGATWRSTGAKNVPMQIDTYSSLKILATAILDPIVENFGPIRLTYGIACGALIKQIKTRIAPKVDQHAAHELSATGKRICDRGGAACDFVVDEFDSLTVAHWLVGNTGFDRLYYYGSNRPIHVSAAEDPKGQCILIKRDLSSRRVLPSVVSIKNFLQMKSNKGDEK